jgi:hypothetical protein
MAYHLPNFNLSINLWRIPSLVSAAPDLIFAANLSPGRRVFLQPPPNVASTFSTYGNFNQLSELLCPKGTDIRGVQNASFTDLVEVPAGTARYYMVMWVEDVGKGFSNEYRFAHIVQMNWSQAISLQGNQWAATPWPVPTP